MIETRKCNCCGAEYPYTSEYFIKSKSSKSGLRPKCKECRSKSNKAYKDKNKETIAARKKAYYEEHKDEISIKDKERYRQNKEKIIQQATQYNKNNKEKHKQYAHDCYLKHKDKYREQNREYRNDNIDRYREYQRQYYREVISKDYLLMLKKRIRTNIRQSFTRMKFNKSGHLSDITGLNQGELVEYLLKTYISNYGYEWDGVEPVHIDHIVPLATATTEEEVKKLCHYSNLQLLKAFDNLSKHDKTDYKI